MKISRMSKIRNSKSCAGMTSVTASYIFPAAGRNTSGKDTALNIGPAVVSARASKTSINPESGKHSHSARFASQKSQFSIVKKLK